MNDENVKRVLIVDDEDDMRTLLTVLLSDGGGDIKVVGEAADGQAALEAWKNSSPDVVILDQRMPGLSGLEVAEHMLADSPDQAIVLFSAYLSDAMREEAATVGIRACMTKEQIFELPELIRSGL